jgi:hypothetical protein
MTTSNYLPQITLIVLLQSLLVNVVFSQRDFKPGYIVTNKYDTVLGFIDDKSSTASLKSCLFKKKIDEETVEYFADDIVSYRYTNGRYFISYRIVDKKYADPVFFEYLLKGKIQIYRAKKLDKGSSFYVKKDSVLYELDNIERSYTDGNGSKFVSSNRYKGQLNYLMNDQPALKNQIDQISILSSDRLIKLSKKYHSLSCPGEECIEYAKTDKSIKVKFGIGVVYGSPKLYLREDAIPNDSYYLNKWDFNKNYFYNFRIPIDIQFISLSRKIGIQVSPGISKIHFGSDEKWETSGYYPNSFYRNAIDVDLVAIQLPICFKYTFQSSDWKVWPFFGIGYQFSYYLKKDIDLYYSLEYDNKFLDTHSDKFEFSDFQDALFVTGGVDLPFLSKKVSVFVNYEFGDGIHRLKFLDSFLKVSRTKMFSFGASFYF